MSRYYRVVPPRQGLAISVLFTLVPVSYKIKNTWLIFYHTLITSLCLKALCSSKASQSTFVKSFEF